MILKKKYYPIKNPLIASHDSVSIDYKLRDNIASNTVVKTRDFRKFDHNLFDTLFKDLIISSEFNSFIARDPNYLLTIFQQAAISSLDKMASLVNKILFRRNPTPWFNDKLRERFKRRDRLYIRAIRLNSFSLLVNFRLMRKQIKHVIRLAREIFLSSISNSADHPSKKWSLLRKHRIFGAHPNSPSAFFSDTDFNKFCASVAKVHPLCSVSQLNEILILPLNSVVPIFEVQPLSIVEVLQAGLATLPKSKSLSC